MTITNINYTFSIIKDVYTLNNINNTGNINYTLYKQGCNSSEPEIVLESFILPKKNKVFDLSDGIYSLHILRNDISSNIYFTLFPLLRKNFITLIENLLCCECSCECNDNLLFLNTNYKTAIDFQAEYNYLLSYFYSIKPLSIVSPQESNLVLLRLMEVLMYNNKCDINSELCKQYFNTCLEGVNTDFTLNKYIISLMYLSLYYYERSTINVEDASEDKYLNTLYNFNSVKKCIKKLGIVIEDLQPTIDNILDEISPINIIPFNNIRVFKDFTTPYEILWEEVLSTIGINLSQIIGSNGEGLSIQFYNYTGLTSTNQIINSYTPGIPDIFTYTDIVNEVIYPWIFSTVFIKGITQATPADEILYFKVFNTNNPSIYYNIRIFLRIV